jgi:hypothetical protein
MLARRGGLVVPLGLLCLSLAVLIGRIGATFVPHPDFFEGLLVGMAAGLSVVGVLAHTIVAWNERTDPQ